MSNGGFVDLSSFATFLSYCRPCPRIRGPSPGADARWVPRRSRLARWIPGDLKTCTPASPDRVAHTARRPRPTGLAAKKVGRKAEAPEAERRIVEPTKRNAQHEKKLHVTTVLIGLDKKITNCWA